MNESNKILVPTKISLYPAQWELFKHGRKCLFIKDTFLGLIIMLAVLNKITGGPLHF